MRLRPFLSPRWRVEAGPPSRRLRVKTRWTSTNWVSRKYMQMGAKLSFENDPHLVREARNFPEHLFHHYDGYSIISQLKAVVPVHAVVPQFYGYYTPKTEEGGGTWENHPTSVLSFY
ncbi:hypothetical protein L210DRAFT_2289374 [Boletus edulis BED1]|uniref:Uncharacterized protein n=1 Tax=Boletus edulis BED1 TaxID=1328754 RepID=A0AAD4BCS8_BOLED|nr:hypothetical protein L210DRAFT_2289374 [Boletus edulis BED1]